MEDIPERVIGKKRIKPGCEGEGGRLRDLYAQLFVHRNILPGDLARQSPRILFAMLDEIDGDGNVRNDARIAGNPYLRGFYGN